MSTNSGAIELLQKVGIRALSLTYGLEKQLACISALSHYITRADSPGIILLSDTPKTPDDDLRPPRLADSISRHLDVGPSGSSVLA